MTKNIIKYGLILTVLIFIISCNNSEILTKSEKEWLKQHPNLSVGISPNQPPYQFFDNKGEIRGMFIDYLTIIEDRLDYKFKKVYQVDWTKLLLDAKEGNVDVVIQIQETEERKEYLNFTPVLISHKHVIVVKNTQKNITSINDLKDKKIAVGNSYAVKEYLSKTYPKYSITSYFDNVTGLRAVSTGQADAFITQQAVATYYIEAEGISNLKIAGEIDYSNKLAIASQKNPDTLNTILTKAVNLITKTEKQNIDNNWLSYEIKPFYREAKFWIIVAVLFLIIIYIIGLFNFILQKRVTQKTSELIIAKEKAEENGFLIQKQYQEQKLADEKAKRAALLLQSSIESPKDIIILSIDKNYYYLYFNEFHKASMLNAYGKEVKIGMNLLECITSEKDRLNSKINYDKALAGESHITIQEFGDINKSYYETRYNPIFNDKNEIIGTTAFSADITARIKTEEALKKNENQLKEAQRLAQIGSWELDIKNDVLSWSDEIYRIFEIDPAKFIPNYEIFLNTTHPEDREKVNFAYSNSLKTKEPYEINHRLQFEYPRIKYVHVQCETIYGADGQPLSSFGTVQDITARIEAEENLISKKKQLEFISNHIPVFISQVDANKRYKFVNQPYAELFGLKPADIIGKHPKEILGAEAFEIANPFMEIALSGKTVSYENEIPNLPNEPKIVYANYIPEFNETGDVEGFIAAITDITERKQAEEKLRESEELLRLSTELANVAAWEMDLVADSMTRSSNHDNLYGLKNVGNWHVNTFMDATHIDDREKCNAFINQSLVPGGPNRYKFDFRILYPDKSIHWLNVIGKIIERDSTGAGIKIRGFITDITDRKQAEEEIYNTNKELQLLNNIILTSVSSKDYNKILNNVLDEALEVVGLEGGTICLINPDNTFNLIAERNVSKEIIKDFTDNKVRIGECLCGNCALERKPFILYTKEDIVKYATREVLKGENIHFHASYPFIATGKSVGILCVFTRTDTKPSLRKLKILETIVSQTSIVIENIKLYEELGNQNINLEQRIIERTEQLNTVNKELQTFTYSVSHDLKAPLRGIDGYSNLLQELYSANLNEEARSFISSIRKGTAQMNMLIEDLLEYSRLERAELRIETIKIKTLLETLKSQFKTEFSDSNCTVNINVPDIEITVDKKGLTIALRNLIDNAIKFSKENKKPTIDISFKNKPAYWEIALKDNGIGFDMNYKDRIFEIFQQLNLPEEFPGTGIGLAMVLKSMEKMGGKVWAESASGKGATFYLQIPKK